MLEFLPLIGLALWYWISSLSGHPVTPIDVVCVGVLLVWVRLGEILEVLKRSQK